METLDKHILECERKYMDKLLRKTHGQVRKAMAIAGISSSQMYRVLGRTELLPQFYQDGKGNKNG